jgi:hypothetical protein
LVALAILATADDRTPVPGFFDLPVTGGTATLDMLGLRPEERGSAIAVLARSMFSQGGSAAERAASVRRFITELSVPGKATAASADAPPVTIAVPLTADHWRDLLAPLGRGDLFPALISNRSVLLVCAGAMNTDASVRSLLERDRGLLRYIVRSAPAAFWVAARSLRLDKDRVVVPGGPAAEAIWEALAGEKISRPAEFIRVLLSRDSGRLGWFFDAVAAMPADRQAVVYGTGPIETQIEQARALYATFRSADSNWRLEDHPFLRGVTDPWIVTSHIGIAGGGVAPPNSQRFWDELFERGDLSRRAATAISADSGVPVSLAWLAQKIAGVAAKERRDRYEMVRFAQAVFPTASTEASVDVMVALKGYRRYRALLLALDRMEVATPRVYSRAVEAARRLDELSGRDRKHAIVAFQASLAILERARVTRAIDVPAAEQLVLALADVAEADTRHAQAITQWMITGLLGALPPLVQPDQWTAATAYESRFLQALAGAPRGTAAATLTWEGLDYRVDYFASEHARITRIREQLTSPGLDAALAANNDALVAEALLVLIYAPALGDPEGPALLGGDIALRHNFGVEGAAGLRRDLLAWSLPREQVGDGNPWHIEGSLLGLDIALARLALRRLSDDDMPVAPTINLNDQLTLAKTARALNPYDLNDADRDRIVEAIGRGRQRVAGASNLADLAALANEAGLSAAVKQTLAWTHTRTPELVPALFALRDFLWLGRPDLPLDTLHRWGVYAEALHNRLRTAMPAPTPWENLGGRADGGLIATQLPDLTLRLAEETVRLKLPAQLIPALLTFATQDYWHDVDSRFPDDWPAMARQALALSPSRVEDYVAALAGDGPLRPK